MTMATERTGSDSLQEFRTIPFVWSWRDVLRVSAIGELLVLLLTVVALRDLLAADETLAVGDYRLTFDTQTYFQRQNVEAFYPQVTVTFAVRNAAQHYHVPLLLSPFGYSTYRGS